MCTNSKFAPISKSRDNFVKSKIFTDATIILDIGEGEIHQTSIATMVTIGSRAVNQVLFAKRHKTSSFTEMLAFQSSSGTERPAGSALALVFHGSHGTVGPPVNVFGQSHVSGFYREGLLLIEIQSILAARWHGSIVLIQKTKMGRNRTKMRQKWDQNGTK